MRERLIVSNILLKKCFMDSEMHCHAAGCKDKGVDKWGRCTKCRSAYNNMTQKRHPVLFNLPSICTPTVQENDPLSSMLPSDVRIGEVVSERLENISENDNKKIVIYDFNNFNNKNIKYSADSIAKNNHILTKNGYIYIPNLIYYFYLLLNPSPLLYYIYLYFHYYQIFYY